MNELTEVLNSLESINVVPLFVGLLIVCAVTICLAAVFRSLGRWGAALVLAVAVAGFWVATVARPGWWQ